MPLFTDSKLTGRVAALESQLSEVSEGQKKILALLEASKGEPSKKGSKDEEKMKGKKGAETDPDQAENDSDPVAGGAGSEPENAGEPEKDPVDGEQDGSADEEPMREPSQKDGKPDFNKGETSADPDADEEEAEGEADKEEDESKGEDEEEEDEEPSAPQPKPKTGKKASKETKGISLAAEVAELKAQLAELTQKGLAQAAANIGIKPIARADKAENAPDEADPVKRTYANWSKPIKTKN